MNEPIDHDVDSKLRHGKSKESKEPTAKTTN